MLRARLDAEAAESSHASFTKAIRRRRRPMTAWLYLPIVIPTLMIVTFAGYLLLQAFH
jgi:hypothetical protein